MGESFSWGSPFLVFFFENDKFRNNKSSESNSRISYIIVIGQKGGVFNEMSPFFVSNQITRNEMKKEWENKRTETYNVKRDTPCLKNHRHPEKFNLFCNIPSHGWVIWELFNGLDYDITNLKLIDNHPIIDTFYDVQSKCRVDEKEVNWSHYYSFELWDEHGHIGDYRVERLDFEENCKLISSDEKQTGKEYWDTFESITKNHSLFSTNSKNNQLVTK